VIMTISETTIQELRQILKEDYGKEVTQAEAFEIAHTLVSYFTRLQKIYHQMKTQNDNDDKITNN